MFCETGAEIYRCPWAPFLERLKAPAIQPLIRAADRRYLQHFYNRLSNRTDVWTPDVLEMYTDAFSQAGAMRCGMDLYRTFHADVKENKEWLAEHGKCKVPACAFSGGASFLQSIAKAQTEELYESVEVYEVAGSGHWVAEENPEDCVKGILQFVAKHNE